MVLYNSVFRGDYMEVSKIELWKKGFKDAIPIGLGYFAVSLTFGLQCGIAGLGVFEATLLSFCNLTSAGQFGGLELIVAQASYFEMAFTQFILNLRYVLMSTALSQKLDSKASIPHRMLVSHGITDEIFGISMAVKGKLSPYYSYGAMSCAIPCWTLGTLTGVSIGNILPLDILNALSIAIYGMFIAIIIPPAKKNKTILFVVILSMVTSLLFEVLPVLNLISSGFKIIVVTIIIASLAAYFFPVQEDTYE